jgi:hypothetical protein
MQSSQDATGHVSHCTLAMQGHCSTFINVNRILDCNLTTRKSCSGCPPTTAMTCMTTLCNDRSV